jgi:hypothetical protein
MPLQPAILGTARLNNFRLAYLPAALIPPRETRVGIWLNGEYVTHRVRRKGFSIRDVLNDAPNTCSLTLEGEPAPEPAMRLKITLNSNTPRLLFEGSLQTVDTTYQGRPQFVAYPCRAIDDTPRANRRLPFRAWMNVSATTVAQELVAAFAPGFTATHVQAGLPTVTVAFDGTEGLNGALRQIAKLIGGYFYWEAADLHLFLEELTDAPEPVDGTGRLLMHDPPIVADADDSQLRTRVYGKGHGEALLCDVLASETILPVKDVTLFNPGGGRAIVGVTPDGSTIIQVAYTGVHVGGLGALVGTGALPSGAPTLTLAGGVGLAAGVYKYAYTFVTPSGESLPGPLGTVTISGATPPPASGPTVGVPAAGGAVDVGIHDYQVTYVTALGETTVGPASAGVVVSAIASPTPAPTLANDVSAGVSSIWSTGDSIVMTYTYVTAAGETVSAGNSNAVTAVTYSGGATARGMLLNVVASTDPRVTFIKVYIRINGSFAFSNQYSNATGNKIINAGVASGAPPAVATGVYQQIPLTAIPVGDATVTGRKLYRRFNGGGTYKLAATLANNTATTYTDALANSGLGAVPPAVNTAVSAQVALSGIAVGGGATTSRKIYRTVANGAQLKLQQTIANNSATTGVTDATADGSLGANAPTSDTSLLLQPAGQVNAGSTTIPVATAAPFPPVGGWVELDGNQLVRYAAVSGNSLLGIPAAGPGAIVSTVVYNTVATARPALVGVTGLTEVMLKGSLVHLFVQRDDVTAQSVLGARDLSDGIIEHLLVDRRRGEASLVALCDADLALFSRSIITVRYATRDVKTKSGKPVVVTLTSPSIHETLTIQDVTITEIDVSPGVPPRYTVSATSVRYSLEDTLRRVSALLAE